MMQTVFQVWCVESEEQQNHNWTVDSGHHTLEISTLKPGRRYWITIAAVNGAGVGMLSDPHGFVISEWKEYVSVHLWKTVWDKVCTEKPETLTLLKCIMSTVENNNITFK